MNRTLIAVLVVGIALTGCTVQQREMASNALADDPAPVVTEPAPSIATVAADCNWIHVTVTAAEGIPVYVGVGPMPPYGFTAGSDELWQFHRVAGDTYEGTLAVAEYEGFDGYDWGVDLGDTRVASGHVDCQASAAAS